MTMFSRERNKSTDSIIRGRRESEDNGDNKVSVIELPQETDDQASKTRNFVDRAKDYLICSCCLFNQNQTINKIRLMGSVDTLSSRDMASQKKKTWTKSVSDLTDRIKQRCQPSPGPVKKEVIRNEEGLKMEDLKLSSSERTVIFFGKVKHFLRLNALRRPLSKFALPITPRGFDNHKCCQHGSYVKGYDPTDGMEFYDNSCFSLDEADVGMATAGPDDSRTMDTCISRESVNKSMDNSCSDISISSAESRASNNAVSLSDVHFCLQNEQLSKRHRSAEQYASCSLCEDDVPSYIMDMSMPDRLDQNPTTRSKWKNRLRTKSLPSGLHLQLALGPAMMMDTMVTFPTQLTSEA